MGLVGWLKNLILFAQNNLAPVFDFDFAFAIYSRLRNSRRGRLGPRAVGILALFAFLIAIILVIALLIAIALVVPRRDRVSLLRFCASWPKPLAQPTLTASPSINIVLAVAGSVWGIFT